MNALLYVKPCELSVANDYRTIPGVCSFINCTNFNGNRNGTSSENLACPNGRLNAQSCMHQLSKLVVNINHYVAQYWKGQQSSERPTTEGQGSE